MSRIDPSEIVNLTIELVHQPSVTGTRVDPGRPMFPFNETLIAEWIHRWFQTRSVRSVLQEVGDGRKNVFAFLPGASARTVILMGHFDTVPVSAGQLAAPPAGGDDGFLYGRGALDMKSGIAVAMKLMESWGKDGAGLPVSVLFVATCDEEVESAGILRAIELIALMKGHPALDETDGETAAALTGGGKCEFLGVVNVDYTTERHPGDTDYHAWNGTVGKVLAGVYVRGFETHAGEYYRGFHAMSLLSRLVAGIDGNTEFSGHAPPPVTLKIRDRKEEYNVMTSPDGWAYFNIFTTRRTPADILEQLRKTCLTILYDYLRELQAGYDRYCREAKIPSSELHWKPHIRTYSELLRMAVERAGEDRVADVLSDVIAPGDGADIREQSFSVIESLLTLLGDHDPVIVLAFLPPFYPYIPPDRGVLGTAAAEAVSETADGTGRKITLEHFYPYISDMSYLKMDRHIRESLGELTGEMPAWERGYELDFDTIGNVDLPVVNIGPYGFGAHQPGERAEKHYTFEVLPALIDRLVRRLK